MVRAEELSFRPHFYHRWSILKQIQIEYIRFTLTFEFITINLPIMKSGTR